MILGGIVAIFFGVAAEGKSLEAVATLPPLARLSWRSTLGKRVGFLLVYWRPWLPCPLGDRRLC